LRNFLLSIIFRQDYNQLESFIYRNFMLKDLKQILEIQELDMQMIQLMFLKRQRQKELVNIDAKKLLTQTGIAEIDKDILEMKKDIRVFEGDLQDVLEKIKKLEAQQTTIKKVDEYNALTQELSLTDRERLAKEQKLSDLYDKLAVQEDFLKTAKKELEQLIQSSKISEEEIVESITAINDEGQGLKSQRDELVKGADVAVFKIYERLLCNKKDRVVVPLESRCCSGCHIMLTPQHENLVRKGERLVFCEHCSRIHYWQESEALEDTSAASKQRRRRASTKS
jgi:uncharacterized protein